MRAHLRFSLAQARPRGALQRGPLPGLEAGACDRAKTGARAGGRRAWPRSYRPRTLPARGLSDQTHSGGFFFPSFFSECNVYYRQGLQVRGHRLIGSRGVARVAQEASAGSPDAPGGAEQVQEGDSELFLWALLSAQSETRRSLHTLGNQKLHLRMHAMHVLQIVRVMRERGVRWVRWSSPSRNMP